jgi:hypothetical protein
MNSDERIANVFRSYREPLFLMPGDISVCFCLVSSLLLPLVSEEGILFSEAMTKTSYYYS